MSTRCSSCARIAWPPRSFCPHCHCDTTEWTEIGKGATLYAFTQQARALRFAKPQVIGIVDVPDVGRLVSAIDAPFSDLEIGIELEPDVVEIHEGRWVHQFRPA